MKIGSDCTSGKAFVFYDPSHAEDAHHANLIKATLPNCSLVRVWMIGHGVTTTLAGSETLKDLIAACRVEDLIRIRAVVAKKRRIGGQRLFRLTDRLMTKHGRLFLKYLIPFSFNGNRWASEQVRTVSKQMRSRITSFLASHDPQLLKTYDKSLALAETAWLSEAPHRYWSEEQALIRFKQCCIPDSRTDAREVSSLPDGQYLAFDFFMLMLRGASKAEMILCQNSMCPAKLSKTDGRVQLVCRPCDIDHPLTHMNPGNFFGLSPAARSSDSIRLEVENEGSGVTIFDAGRGLIVETGGKLSQARQGGSERSLFDLVECPSEQDTHFIRLT